MLHPHPLGLEVPSGWFLCTLLASHLSLFEIFFGHGVDQKCQWANSPGSDSQLMRNRKISTQISLPLCVTTQEMCFTQALKDFPAELTTLVAQSSNPLSNTHFVGFSLLAISHLYALTLLSGNPLLHKPLAPTPLFQDLFLKEPNQKQGMTSTWSLKG